MTEPLRMESDVLHDRVAQALEAAVLRDPGRDWAIRAAHSVLLALNLHDLDAAVERVAHELRYRDTLDDKGGDVSWEALDVVGQEAYRSDAREVLEAALTATNAIQQSDLKLGSDASDPSGLGATGEADDA